MATLATVSIAFAQNDQRVPRATTNPPWQRKMLKLRTPQLAMCPASLLQSTKKRFRIERASKLADGRTGGFYAMTRQFRKQGIVD
jgi:hypothetical protein